MICSAANNINQVEPLDQQTTVVLPGQQGLVIPLRQATALLVFGPEQILLIDQVPQSEPEQPLLEEQVPVFEPEEFLLVEQASRKA